MTFDEFLTANPRFFVGLDLDEATQSNLHDWFYFRELCDEEKVFGLMFYRLLKRSSWQYNQLLRLESVQFDPMVSSYLENWTNHESKTTAKGATTGGSTMSHTGEDVNTHEDTTTPGITQTVTGKTDATASGTRTDDLHNKSTAQGTSDGKTTSKGNDEKKSLNGVLPQTSTYAGGMPADLNWKYADGQNQEASSNSGEGTSHDENTGSSSSDNTGTQKTESKSGGNSTTTTTFTGEDKKSSSDTYKKGTTETGTSNGTTSNDTTASDTTKQISTGRGEAPQDMLDRARMYIGKMNAFKWLCDQCELAFFGVYDI